MKAHQWQQEPTTGVDVLIDEDVSEAFLEAFIYAVMADCVDKTLVKIGRASSVRQRMNEFQVCCPFPIRQVYACNVITTKRSVSKEKAMHKMYMGRHFRGEWFDVWGGIASGDQIKAFEESMIGVAKDGAEFEVYAYRFVS